MSSWKEEMGAQRAKDRERRIKAREKAAQRRKDELVGYKPGDREYQEIQHRHKSEDWDAARRHRQSQYDRLYGAGAARANIRQMEQFARRREQDLDFIRRVEAGERDFEGDLADIKTGKAWEQGQLDAYNDYQENYLQYKKDPTSFDYDSYFPDDPRRSRRKPTYEQHMGKYYDSTYDDFMARGGTIATNPPPNRRSSAEYNDRYYRQQAARERSANRKPPTGPGPSGGGSISGGPNQGVYKEATVNPGYDHTLGPKPGEPGFNAGAHAR